LYHGRTAAALGPADPSSLVWVAEALMKVRRYDEALQLLGRAIDSRRDDPDLLAQCGDAALAAGRSTLAVDLFERAIKLRPGEPSFYYRAGVARRQRKQYSSAIRYLRRAVQLRPSYGDAIHELSRLGPLAFAAHYMSGDTPPDPPEDSPRIDD